MSNTINQPGQGAIHMPSRFDTKKYVHQPFPSTRFHPDGRVVTVADEEDDTARCPAADGWRDRPYPPKPVEVPKPEPTVAELKIKLIEQTHAFDKSWAELTGQHEELTAAHEEQRKDLDAATLYSVEQGSELLSLRKENQEATLYSVEQGNEILSLRKENQELRARVKELTPVVEPVTAETPAEAPPKKNGKAKPE